MTPIYLMFRKMSGKLARKIFRQVAGICLALLLTSTQVACNIQMGAPVPAATATPAVESVNAFAARLTLALISRDYNQLQGMMASPFVLAGWLSEGSELPAGVAIVQLRNNYFAPANAIAFPANVDLTALLGGTDPLTMWGAEVQAKQAIYVADLGPNNSTEALLIIAQKPDGTPYWYSILLATAGFVLNGAPQPTISPTSLATVASTATTLPPTAVPPTTLPSPTVLPTAVPPAVIPTTVPASEPVSRIQFVAGSTGGIVRGTVNVGQRKQYLLRALAGQVMSVGIASPAGTANFAITGVSDGQSLKPLENEARAWSDVLPLSQDYLITVVSTVATAYQLTVHVDPLAAPTPAPTVPPVTEPQRIQFAPDATSATVAAPR